MTRTITETKEQIKQALNPQRTAIEHRLMKLEAWDIAQARQAIDQYEGLLSLIQQYPTVRLVPNRMMDAVGHVHIGEADETIDFAGMQLCHEPGLGTRGDRDRQQWLAAFAQTRHLYEGHFGAGAMGDSLPARCEIFEMKQDR